MVDELRQAFELAQQQPDDVQRRIAELVELEEREWEAIVASSEGRETLDRLVAEAKEENARGDVEDGGWTNT